MLKSRRRSQAIQTAAHPLRAPSNVSPTGAMTVRVRECDGTVAVEPGALPMSFTISDLVVETLAAAAVRRVYGLPGDSLNGLTDALRRNGTLAWEHVRHDEAVYGTRSVLPGRTDELIDLARTNVTRRLFA